jgi:short-subunit dehydrogenase involved in D-alanine esterification of teichoic acids
MTPEERFERIENNLLLLTESVSHFVQTSNESMLSLAAGQKALQADISALTETVANYVAASERSVERLEAATLANQQSFEELRAMLRAFIDSLRRGGNGHPQ